ncbi:manganese efflux pump, partial [Campylobacter coli]
MKQKSTLKKKNFFTAKLVKIAPILCFIHLFILVLIGLKMIKESFENENCDTNSNQFGFKIMFALAVATSVDALAI